MAESCNATKFTLFLEALPEIAANINKFESEKAQMLALKGLIGALGLNEVPRVPTLHEEVNARESVEADDATPQQAGTPSNNSSSPRRRRNGARSKRSFSPVKGINFAPDGQQSLEEFIAKKDPKNNDERNLVACYYLKEVLGYAEVGVGEVLAVYLDRGWTAPARPDTSLQNTASRNAWLDTKDMKNIVIPWSGINQVSKMPTKQQGTSV